MDRRDALIPLIGSIVLLPGCSAFERISEVKGETSVPAVISKEIKVIDRRCEDEDTTQHESNTSYDATRNRLSLKGSIAAYKPCLELGLVVQDGAGLENREIDDLSIDVGIRSPNEACEPCPANIDYEATVTFDDDPRSVEVYHEKRERRVGPITANSTRQG